MKCCEAEEGDMPMHTPGTAADREKEACKKSANWRFQYATDRV